MPSKVAHATSRQEYKLGRFDAQGRTNVALVTGSGNLAFKNGEKAPEQIAEVWK